MYAKIFLLSLFVAIIAFYFNPSCLKKIFDSFNSQVQTTSKNAKIFTIDSLRRYNGIDRPELYLAILGKVFDVTKGSKHYGPGQSYNFFIGKDASRSFISGKFGPEDADDRVSDLTSEELRSLNHWVKFYSKEYTKVGKLMGRFYDVEGKLTRYGIEVRKLIKGAESEKESQDLDKIKYPPCNVEWDLVQGTRVWCSNRSGGISRDWIGVPRQLYEPGSRDYRCACISPQHGESGNLKEYEGCERNSDSCLIKI